MLLYCLWMVYVSLPCISRIITNSTHNSAQFYEFYVFPSIRVLCSVLRSYILFLEFKIRRWVCRTAANITSPILLIAYTSHIHPPSSLKWLADSNAIHPKSLVGRPVGRTISLEPLTQSDDWNLKTNPAKSIETQIELERARKRDEKNLCRCELKEIYVYYSKFKTKKNTQK